MGGLIFAAGRGLKPAGRTVPQLALSLVRHSGGGATGQQAEAQRVLVEGVSIRDLQLTRKGTGGIAWAFRGR